jgi:hypothetical protein
MIIVHHDYTIRQDFFITNYICRLVYGVFYYPHPHPPPPRIMRKDERCINVTDNISLYEWNQRIFISYDFV